MPIHAPRELVGRVLDETWSLEEVIGFGGVAIVMRASHVADGRRVAVKVVLPADSGDPEMRNILQQRLQREGAAITQLSHPNTVRVFDYGETADGLVFLVMELLEGQTLRDVLDHEGRMAPARAARIGRQLCASLREAHERGLVHRDVKPANVFLVTGEDGVEVVKLVDFGAVWMEPSGRGRKSRADARLTREGSTVGTPAYMSPEQAAAEPMSPATDIYSLGVVLYELVSGQPPFLGASDVAVMIQHMSKAPPELELGDDIAPEEAAGWQKLVDQMLQKAPGARPESVAVVAEALALLDPETAPLPELAEPEGFGNKPQGARRWIARIGAALRGE